MDTGLCMSLRANVSSAFTLDASLTTTYEYVQRSEDVSNVADAFTVRLVTL